MIDNGIYEISLSHPDKIICVFESVENNITILLNDISFDIRNIDSCNGLNVYKYKLDSTVENITNQDFYTLMQII